MIFEWDENKNITNIAKHGIDFNDVVSAFDFDMLVRRDEREDYGEERFIGIGRIMSVEIVLVWTIRENKIRIISARQANKKERNIYYDAIHKN
jgi:hypothetical protein